MSNNLKIKEIIETDQCVGCAACANTCPRQCIAMPIHESGFYRPLIDESQCIGCGKCDSVCPVAEESDKDCLEPRHVYASWHLSDDVRNVSSSGGLFSAIAEHVLESGGVVFGAAFDKDLVVKHRAVDSIAELDVLRRSKYVQSQVNEKTYRQVIAFLKDKRTVFFVGTPCQVAGLKNVVQSCQNPQELSEYLLTADLICHGVPSPVFLTMHLKELEEKFKSKIVSVNFRLKKFEKNVNWGTYFLCIFENGNKYVKPCSDDFFYHSFLKNICLQQGCYSCPYAKPSRTGDLTLGDFWGIGNEISFSHSTEKGVSLAMVNTQQGENFLHQLKDNVFFEERSLAEAVKGPSKLRHPATPHPRRNEFKKDLFEKKLGYSHLKRKYFRLYSWVNRLKKLLGKNAVAYLKKIKNAFVKK